MRTKWTMLPLAILALAVVASAADISGTWKGTAQSANGPIERTFNFKVDGNKLTGDTTSEVFGKSTIEDGKIDGDTVTFTITVNYQGNEGKVNYTGKVNGDQIDFTVEIPAFNQTVKYSAKRVTESKESKQ
jgi:autotransporter translocation and assembly factor TamB